jgi:hypothetical protein
MPYLRALLSQLITPQKVDSCLARFYTPLALPLVQALPRAPEAIIYDCMDELSLFKGAPPELLGHESELLRRADVVFTGGRSLYRAKQGRHPNLHCFPSSVDLRHFQKARPGQARALGEPLDQAALAHPRLGFYGVIDERLDLALLDGTEHRLLLADGSSVAYDQLISTMPLPVFIRMLGQAAPADVLAAAAGLRHVSVRCVNIGVGREAITDKHWIYYPKDTAFHRIFVQGNASPHCNPPGGFGFTCEITYSPHKPLPAQGDALIRRCIDDCRRVGFIREDDPIWAANEIDMPYAYVVYDHQRAHNVGVIREWLKQHDILLAGRYSEWEYYNSDHAFISGKRAAEAARVHMPATTAPMPPALEVAPPTEV